MYGKMGYGAVPTWRAMLCQSPNIKGEGGDQDPFTNRSNNGSLSQKLPPDPNGLNVGPP